MSYRTLSLGVAVCGLIAIFSQQLVAAAEHAAIAPYLTDDVCGVAYVDLNRVDLPKVVDELLRVGVIPEVAKAEATHDAAAIQAHVSDLRKLAVRRAYVLFRVSDVAEGGMTWIVEIDRGGNAAEAAKSLNEWRSKFLPPAGTPTAAMRGLFVPKEFAAIGETSVAAGTVKQLDRVRELQANGKSDARPDALQALAGLGDADAGIAVVGDAESRRVVREMFPTLPAPFAEIDGRLLADGVRWGGIGLTLPPKFQLTITADAATPAIAKTLEQTVGKAMLLAKAFLTKESVDDPPVHQARAKGLLPLLSLVAPKVDGSQLSISFGDDEEEVAFLRDFVPALTQQMRDESHRRSRMNNFKQITLGMLNYESARGSLPAAASYDAEGRPLLSWRVYVLPYMEQQALFNQFHLDEPWDSEHNRKLIDQMPEMFADPDPAVRAAVEDKGRTTFVVPTGEGMVFGKKEGTKIKEMIDGTSNTILVVEVVPERAVVWTKPDDWEVDMANPLAGVSRKDRDSFIVGWADGHASSMSNNNSPELMRKTLTPAGKEIIDQNEIK